MTNGFVTITNMDQMYTMYLVQMMMASYAMMFFMPWMFPRGL